MDTQPLIDSAKLFWGESKGFWVQTGALVISAFAAVWVIAASDKSQRRRATIQLLIHQKRDHDLQKAKGQMSRLYDSAVKNFARFLEQPEGEELQAMLRVLDNYEFIAAGIHEDALDGEIFKRMQYSVLLRDWNALQPLVIELRKSHGQTLYQEFEELAKEWTHNPLKMFRS